MITLGLARFYIRRKHPGKTNLQANKLRFGCVKRSDFSVIREKCSHPVIGMVRSQFTSCDNTCRVKSWRAFVVWVGANSSNTMTVFKIRSGL